MSTGYAVAVEVLVVLVLAAAGTLLLDRQLAREEKERHRAATLLPWVQAFAEIGFALTAAQGRSVLALTQVGRQAVRIAAAAFGTIPVPMSAAQAEATTTELVRLTLGSRPDRPELAVPISVSGASLWRVWFDEAAAFDG